LSGRWLMFGQRYNKPIYLSFKVRDRRAYSNTAPSSIGSEVGLLWGTADGFNDSGFQVPDFFVDQKLLDSKMSVRYGQFSIDKFVDKHSLRSSKRFFLNQAFSDNPTVNFPSFGAGANIDWQIHDKFGFFAGISNVQGTDADKEVDLELSSTALFMALQGIYSFTGIGGRDARAQFMGWNDEDNREEDYRDGKGISLTIEHEGASKDEVYIFRLAGSDGDSTGTDTIIFLGFGKKIFNFDHLGMGIGAGRSSTTSEWQSVAEVYYRWQVTKELLITPDLQIITGTREGATNKEAGSNKLGFAIGIRAGLVF